LPWRQKPLAGLRGPATWFHHSIASDYCGTLAGMFGPILRDVNDVPIEVTE
jgi:hypothetical protein